MHMDEVTLDTALVDMLLLVDLIVVVVKEAKEVYEASTMASNVRAGV